MRTLLLLWLAVTGSAERFVHTALVSSVPAADSVAVVPVREIRLLFSEAVDPALATVTVSGPGGPLGGGTLEAVAATEGRELRLALGAPLLDGAYTVAWRVAGPDGHPITGTFGFRVELPPPVDTPRAGPSIGPAPPLPLAPRAAPLPGFVPGLVRWLLYAVTTGMLGVAAFRWAMLEPLQGERAYALLAYPALRRAWAAGWVVAALALALLPLRLATQAVELFAGQAVGRSAGMLASSWGIGWWIEALSVAAFAGGLALAGAHGRRSGWLVVGAAALLGALVPALAGHAMDENPLGRAALLNDALHVVAAGAWLGGLALVLLVGLPAAREADVPRELDGGPPLAALVLGRFSRVALIAVGVLALTGAVNGWIQVRSLGALGGSVYGRTLLLKLALVLPAALLGLYHWRSMTPRIGAGLGSERIRPTAAGELGLGLLVLAVTAVLALTPPPRPGSAMEQAPSAVVEARP